MIAFHLIIIILSISALVFNTIQLGKEMISKKLYIASALLWFALLVVNITKFIIEFKLLVS